MKTIKITALALLTLLLCSCSSEDDSTSSGNDLFINFTLNGTDISITGDAEVISAFSGDGFINLVINGSVGTIGNSDYARIALSIPERTVDSGTYNFSADISQSNQYRCNIVTSASEYLGSGSVTITANDGETISGTFSGTSFNPNGSVSQEITNGSFKAISNPNQ